MPNASQRLHLIHQLQEFHDREMQQISIQSNQQIIQIKKQNQSQQNTQINKQNQSQ